MKTRTLRVDPLARVEGEGVLYVKLKEGKLEEVQFQIVEPPRLFEALLRQRSYLEASDITARICGICPVAYQMSTIHAMEQVCGFQIEGQLRALRRLLYCGEWIESHVLHVFMLHAPDFLGYEDSIQMAKVYPELVQNALKLKKAGNAILRLLGGREIHPINVRVGGFYRVPTKRELTTLAETLQWGRETALDVVHWASKLPYPDYEREYEYVALRHPNEYPFNEGRLISNKGLDISASEYEQHFEEVHMPHSTALYSFIKGRGAYLTGPLARYNLNFDLLSPLAQDTALEAGLEPSCHNPFKSLLVRCVEILYAFDEALRIIAAYEPPEQSFIAIPPRAGLGHAITEAPRGILYHRYQIDGQGQIQNAKIVPPTSQNQKSIELDLRQCAERFIRLPEEEFIRRCEQTIRNYDPCISCSTHFLQLHIERE